jgi:hypothetical protein
MFGVKAYAGRLLTPSDDRPNSTPVTVMSHRLWQQYGSNPSIMGSVFNLNGKPFTVVGIAPPGFFGDTLSNTAPDFFLPLATEPMVQTDNSLLHSPNASWLDVIGRVPWAKAWLPFRRRCG